MILCQSGNATKSGDLDVAEAVEVAIKVAVVSTNLSLLALFRRLPLISIHDSDCIFLHALFKGIVSPLEPKKTHMFNFCVNGNLSNLDFERRFAVLTAVHVLAHMHCPAIFNCSQIKAGIVLHFSDPCVFLDPMIFFSHLLYPSFALVLGVCPLLPRSPSGSDQCFFKHCHSLARVGGGGLLGINDGILVLTHYAPVPSLYSL